MKRYFHVYLRLLRMNISAMFAYRANFVNSIISTTGWGILSIFAVFLLTSKATSVFGWSRDELFLLIGIYNIINGMFVMFFARNFEKFSRLINFGQLDSILVKPIDSQFSVSLSIFNITGFARIIIGSIFTTYIVNQLKIHVSIIGMGEFLLLLIFSMVTFYTVWFSVLILAIWFNNLTNLVDFLYVVNNLGRYPSEMITSTRNIFLFILVPVTLMATIPAKGLLSHLTIQDTTMFIVIAVGLFILSRKFYFFALRSYTSASS